MNQNTPEIIELFENSIFTTDEEREALIEDKERVAKLFMTTFLGFLALYGAGKPKASLVSYLRSEKRVTLRNITDENNDLSLVIKLAMEAGVIRRKNAREMTKLVYLLKKLSIDEIDESAVFDMVTSNLKLHQELTGKFKSEYGKYRSGESNLYQLIYRLRVLIRSDDDLSTEFKDIFIKYTKLLKTKANIKDDDENTISPKTDAVDKKIINKSNKASLQIAKDKAADAAIAPKFDLSNPNSVTDAFIQLIESPDPSKLLRELGTTLKLFPWGEVKVNNDVAFSWYKNRQTTKLRDSYLKRVNVVNYISGTPPTNNRKDDVLYTLGLIEALKRGKNKVEYVKEIFEIWKRTDKVLDSRIGDALGEVYSVSKDDGFSVLLKILGGETSSFGELSIKLLYRMASEKRPKEITEYVVNYLIKNFEKFDSEERKTAAMIILSHKPSNIFNSSVNSFFKDYNSRFSKYETIRTSKDAVAAEFGASWMEFYSKLEDNNFYGSQFLKSFEIVEEEAIDTSRLTIAEIYQRSLGRLVQTIEEETFLSIIDYVKRNNLQSEWVESLPGFDTIKDFKITTIRNSKDISVERAIGYSSDLRTLSDVELKFIVLSIGEYVLRKNKDNIFRTVNLLEGISIAEGIIFMFDDKLSRTVWMTSHRNISQDVKDLFNKLSTDKKLKIELQLGDKEGPGEGGITTNFIRRRFSSVSSVLGGLDIESSLSSEFQPKIIAKRMVDLGIEQFIYPPSGTPKYETYNIPTLRYDWYWENRGPVFPEDFVKSLFKEIFKYMVSQGSYSDLIFGGYAYRSLIYIALETLPSSDNQLVSDAIDYIDESVKQFFKGNPERNRTPFKDSVAITLLKARRGMLDLDALQNDQIYNVLKWTHREDLSSPDVMGLTKILMEREPEEFLQISIENVKTGMYSPAHFHEALEKIGNKEFIKKFQDGILEEGDFIRPGVRASGYKATINTQLVNGFFKNDDIEFKKKLAAKCIKDLSNADPAGLEDIFKYGAESIVSILSYLEDEEFNEFIESNVPNNQKRKIGMLYSTKKILSEIDIREHLFNEEEVIKPMMELSDERLLQILEFNDIKINAKGIRKLKSESYSDYLKRIQEKSKEKFNLGKVKAEIEEIDSEMITRRTIEYNRLYTNSRHGDVALKFIKSVVASPELTKPTYHDFKREHSDSIMLPVFHGTGSVAASMIMRFGFTIIKASDSSTVGRMLGNGIYFSNILDKSAQYVGDSGYTRGKGVRGYLLEMEAVIGKKNTDYQVAGVDGRDGIRSPEWVVFDPGNQLSIKKAHEVEIVSKSEIRKLESALTESTGDYKSEFATPLKGFAEWVKPIKESINVDTERYSCTFIFKDGNIPMADGTIKNWRDVGTLPIDVEINSSSLGIALTVYFEDVNIPLEDVYIISNTEDFVSEEGEEYHILSSILRGVILNFSEE